MQVWEIEAWSATIFLLNLNVGENLNLINFVRYYSDCENLLPNYVKKFNFNLLERDLNHKFWNASLIPAQNRRLSISVFPKKLQTYIGEKAVFRCASSGQNKPLLRWNVKNVLGVNADEGLLTFDSVARENTGYYVCTASNQYSTVSTKVKLIVMERKYIDHMFSLCL